MKRSRLQRLLSEKQDRIDQLIQENAELSVALQQKTELAITVGSSLQDELAHEQTVIKERNALRKRVQELELRLSSRPGTIEEGECTARSR